MKLHKDIRLALWMLAPMLLTGCASFDPKPLDAAPFKERAQTRVDDGVTVTTAVLTTQESEAVLGINIGLRRIQAVWIEVENSQGHPYWLVSSALDPEYYSPDEVAYASRLLLQGRYNNEVTDHLQRVSFRNPVPAGGTRSGFIFVNLDEGEKELDVDLISRQGAKFFEFYTHVPGIRTHTLEEAESRYPSKERTEMTEAQLRDALEGLRCCTTRQDGSVDGDPLNIVVIGNPDDLFPAFVRRGWHSAEDTYAGSVWKTVNSFLFGHRYRYSPVSPLYHDGRQQDIALQKARGTIHRRNHLRLWVTPFRHQEKDVWIGQISRDIGVRFTTHSHSLVTHKIDPDIDETRTALIEDMMFSQGLERLGFVSGVNPASENDPRHNMTGDPYFTDGLRAVLLFGRQPRHIEDLKFFGWEVPPERSVTE